MIIHFSIILSIMIVNFTIHDRIFNHPIIIVRLKCDKPNPKSYLEYTVYYIP